MTLVEVLVAMGVLAVGMIGICALFPLAIRNTGTSVNKTGGASMAKCVLESLRRGHFDLRPGPGGNSSVADAMPSRSGSHRFDNVRIPAQLKPQHLPATVRSDPGGNNPMYIACTWNDKLGWTATLVPQSGPNVESPSLYWAQVAIWQQWELLFDDNSLRKGYVDEDGDLWMKWKEEWEQIDRGDYVREIKSDESTDGVWFRIDEAEKKNFSLGFGPFSVNVDLLHLSLAGNGMATGENRWRQAGHLQVASRNHLISLYDTRLQLPDTQ
jgi:hypothetical protein